MLENNSNYDNIKQYLADKLRGMRDKVAQGQIEYDDIKHIEECITVLAEMRLRKTAFVGVICIGESNDKI